eukprot:14437906-Alexandrium_andersonii.AAC.1
MSGPSRGMNASLVHGLPNAANYSTLRLLGGYPGSERGFCHCGGRTCRCSDPQPRNLLRCGHGKVSYVHSATRSRCVSDHRCCNAPQPVIRPAERAQLLQAIEA